MNDFLHGGDIYSFYKRYKKYPLDFSANINPFGVPKSVTEAYLSAVTTIDKYPDIDYELLRKAIAKYESLDKDDVVVGSGAADLIFKIVYALKPDTALLISPTFSEYEKALRSYGSEISYYKCKEKNLFKVEEEILQMIKSKQIFFLCNPANPVGNIIDSSLMGKIIDRSKKENCIIILDECFEEFLERRASTKKYLSAYDNLIILKAFTKTFAIPALRAGYILSKNKKLLSEIKLSSQSWPVSNSAEQCAIASTKEKKFLKDSVRYISREKKYFVDELQKLGVKIYGSEANYIFFKSDADALDKKLEQFGIMIRSCKNYHGLSDRFYRIAVRKTEENLLLINALQKVLNG